MIKLFKLKPTWAFGIYLILDTICVGMGMGVPIFNILYEAKASFIGWLVLMIVVSPFLQLLTTVFGSYLAMLFQLRRSTYAH